MSSSHAVSTYIFCLSSGYQEIGEGREDAGGKDKRWEGERREDTG